MARFRWVGLAIGVGLFAWVLRTTNLQAVWGQLRVLHWRFGIVLLFYAVIFLLDTVGWRYALVRRARDRVHLGVLFRTRLAGEAVNYVTPTAWIGGEPVKAYLLSKRRGVSMTDGMASVVVAKTTFTITMLLFILTGLVVALTTQSLSGTLWRWIGITLIALGVCVALLMAAQWCRPFRRLLATMVRWLPARARALEATVREWDRAVAAFYRQSPQGVLWSSAFHFLGWMAGVVEVFLILRFLHVPVSFATAWTVEALWLLLKSCAFVIPASLGASEGFLLMVCAGLGISAVSGLALGLVRRARELIWVGVGLIEYARGES